MSVERLIEDDPEFWEWLIRKERGQNSNDSKTDIKYQPLYIEIAPLPKKPVKPLSEESDKNNNNSVIDYTVYEF
jgi:hypothetical protein